MLPGSGPALLVHVCLQAAPRRSTSRPMFAVTPQQLMRLVVDAQERRALEETGGWSAVERSLRTDFTRGLDGSNAQDLMDRHTWFQTRTGDVSLPDELVHKKKKKPTDDEQLARRSRYRFVISVLLHDEPTVVMWLLFLSALTSAVVDHIFNKTNNVGESACFLIMALAMTGVRIATEWQRHTQLRELYAQEATDQSATGSVAGMVTVMRNGEPTQLPLEELRVGDVLLVQAGEIVVADGVLTPGSSVAVDESAVVGSSGVVFKDHTEGQIVVAGSRVMTANGVGGAKVLVLCVGERTLEHQLRLVSYRDGELSAWVVGNYRPPITPERTDVGEADAGVEYVSLSTPRDGVAVVEGDCTRVKLEDEREKREKRRKTMRRQWKETEKQKKRDVARAKAKSPFHWQVLQLQRKFRRVGWVTGLVLCVVLLVILLKRPSEDDAASHFSAIVILTLTLVVVTSPEGSDLAMAIAMSAAITRLKTSNVLVRDMYAAETPGSMTVLCVDKTGTLAMNKTAVVHLWTATSALPPCEKGDAMICESLARWVTLLAAQSGESTPSARDDKLEDATEQRKDPYDAALLQFLRDQGIDYERFVTEATGWSTTHVWPFSNERQRKSVIMTQYHTAAATRIKHVSVVTSGAPEIVLRQCTSITASDGVVSPLDSRQQEGILREVVSPHVLAGRRVICIAGRELSGDDGNVSGSSQLESDLVCLAILAFEDPVRANAPQAVEMLQNAGVSVAMVTSDHLTTATEVARRCGILQGSSVDDVEDGCAVMDAGEFRALVTDRNGDIKRVEFERVYPKLRVLARAGPLDKYLLVKGLQLAGERVGMVGDSASDALALSASDVGYALGSSGSSVCRHISNVVLMDDNLTAIATTVAWGRVVRMRMTTYLQLQVMVVLVSLGVVAVGALVKQVSPFAAVQLLWVNFVTIVFVFMSRVLPSRSAVEPHVHTFRPTGGQLFDSRSRAWVLSQTVYQLVVLSLLVGFGDSLFGPVVPSPPSSSQAKGSVRLLSLVSSEVADSIYQSAPITETSVAMTVVFNTFVWMQLFCQAVSHATTDPAIQCRHYYKAWVAMGAVQVIVVQFIGLWFNCVPLSGIQWLVCVTTAMTTVLVDFCSQRVHKRSTEQVKELTVR